MAANANDPYSQNTVTPAQRGTQIIGGANGNCFDAWDSVPQVQNAHDQQAAPDSLYAAPLNNDLTNQPSMVPVVDRQADADVERDANTVTTVIYPVGQIVHSK